MEIIIRPNAESAADLTARMIAAEIRSNPQPVIGLATGGTMEPVYRELCRYHRDEGLDFSSCRTFNLDEYIGISSEDENSYHYYMRQHLFDRVNIPPGNARLPDGAAADPAMAARDYEAAISDCGGIDLQLLGIGHDGHIGFNEPLSSLRSRTRPKILTPLTRRMNARFFDGSVDSVPCRALTMGVGTILEARRILLLAAGADKAQIVAQAMEGPVCSAISASALQFHPCCTVVVDEDAAAELQHDEYYRWVFDKDPSWEACR